MKILLIDNSLDNTGASKALIEAVSHIPPETIQFVFLFPQGSGCLQIVRSKGYPAYGLPVREISKRISDLILYFPSLLANTVRLNRIRRKEKIEIVHVNDLYNMLGLSLKLFTRVAVVTHLRRMPESFPAAIYKVWTKLHVRFANRIIAVSQANKNAIPSNGKTVVVYDPLPDPEKLPAYVPRQALNKKIRVLYLANFTDGKGHLHALKALARLHAELSDWSITLDFYGGNFGMDKNEAYKESLIRFAAGEQLDRMVQFNGPAVNVEEVMKAHDLVLNFSDSESFSRVTLEGLFYGLPVIATDVGGTREMVIDGETGLLVPPKNTEAMFSAIRKMCLDDQLRIRCAETAYTFVRDRFKTEKSVNELVAIYRSLGTGRE
jgi:L-malate glycosyltransferase